MSVLDNIKGPYVEAAGVVAIEVSIVAAAITRGAFKTLFVVSLLLVFYAVTRVRPRNNFNFLANFADPTTWPSYVTLGVIALFGGYLGGWSGLALVAAVLMTNDGRTFKELY